MVVPVIQRTQVNIIAHSLRKGQHLNLGVFLKSSRDLESMRERFQRAAVATVAVAARLQVSLLAAVQILGIDGLGVGYHGDGPTARGERYRYCD